MLASSRSQDLGELQTLADMYRNKQSQVYNEILQLKRTAENLDIHMDRTIDGLRNVIFGGSKQVSAQLAANMDEVLNGTQELTIVQHRGVVEISEKLSDLETSITRLQSEMRGASSLQRVLQSLYFERFRARHDQTFKAYIKTFDWIFEDGAAGHHDSLPSKFLHWLEKRNGIFWIRDKAGSGKSTLMKFLCTGLWTIPHLRIWAEDKKLVFGKYFFWGAGTPLQKSREELLRSLLFDILNECPEFSPRVEMKVGHRLNITTASDEIWTLNLLQEVCNDVLSWDLSAKFCLFIDGLDEYDGFSEDLIEVIQNPCFLF
jgi:hypothetical protein